jgi:hypothetical protein
MADKEHLPKLELKHKKRYFIFYIIDEGKLHFLQSV